jgi:hypothetical protein
MPYQRTQGRTSVAKTKPEVDGLEYWTSVIARALAYLCIHQADLRKEDIATQAKFLTGLGLSNADAAAIIGTTPATVQVSISVAKRNKKTGGKRAKAKK